ncbi:hypothetical protein IVB38_24055 [Bradyrhizobium sp. 38]|nr:hypothetical protein [Bradyrhizobium sp. 38]
MARPINDIAGSKDRQKNVLDIEANAHAIDRPSMKHGASIRSWRRAASKIMVAAAEVEPCQKICLRAASIPARARQ